MEDDPKDRIIQENVSPNYRRTISWLDNLMVVICEFSNGPMEHREPFHSHTHEQITYVAEGELLFFKADKEYHLRKGDVISISPGIQHCIKTLTADVRLIDSFSPVRSDFLKPTGGNL